MTSLARDEPQLEQPAPIVSSVVAAGVLVVMLLWVFWDFFSRQFRWAIEHQADWGHTLIIPAISAYFVYLNRDKLLAKPFKTAWLGLIPIVLGVAWYMVSTIGPPALNHHNVRALGLASTIFGIVLLLCGYRAMIWLWFPLAYMFLFGQTISDRLLDEVTHTLQDIAAAGSYYIFMLLNVDVDRAGNTLTILHQGRELPLNIAEACSGMRMLMAFMALGVAMAYIGLKRNWQRILIILLAVPTAIFVNMLRVVTLGFLSMIDVNLAAGDFHTFIGLIWLVPAFLIYLGLMWVVKQIVIEQPSSNSSNASENA